MFDCINDGINGTNGINIINLNKYHNSNLTSIGFNNCLYLYVMNISKLHILNVSTIIAYYFSIIPSSRPKYQILCVVITIICVYYLIIVKFIDVTESANNYGIKTCIYLQQLQLNISILSMLDGTVTTIISIFVVYLLLTLGMIYYCVFDRAQIKLQT